MKTLAEIYEKYAIHGGDKGHGDKGTTHSYIPEYEKLLAPYRDKCTFMEVGLAYGMSVALWDEYFSEDCNLLGACIGMVFDTSKFPRWTFLKQDATKPEFVKSLPEGTRFDVVIDDASHMDPDQTGTRDLLMPLMNPGGLYIIEDILSLEQTTHLWKGAEIHDLRSVKGRFDDVLVVYRT